VEKVYGSHSIHNKKGGLVMNNAVYFAHGLILGAILAAWVAFMIRK
jgi:hypothetical protein